MRLALLGFGIGMLVVATVTRLIRSLLYGISASDPAAFVSVASLLICLVLLACFVPACRAMPVGPMVALRHE
jgi:ABC-type lipoprotein release transport system permease subunit